MWQSAQLLASGADVRLNAGWTGARAAPVPVVAGRPWPSQQGATRLEDFAERDLSADDFVLLDVAGQRRLIGQIATGERTVGSGLDDLDGARQADGGRQYPCSDNREHGLLQ